MCMDHCHFSRRDLLRMVASLPLLAAQGVQGSGHAVVADDERGGCLDPKGAQADPTVITAPLERYHYTDDLYG